MLLRYALSLFTLLLISLPAYAQDHFTDCLEPSSANNATTVIPDDVESNLGEGVELAEGDEIAAFTEDDVCAGVVVWDGSSLSMGLAGEAEGIPEGFETGETINYVVWQRSTDAEIHVNVEHESCDESDPEICSDEGVYLEDALYTLLLIEDENIPVELTTFTAMLDGSQAILSWETATETNNAGFSIEHRGPDGDEWTVAGFVEGHGTTTRPQSYRFDSTPLPLGTHRFRLKQVDFDGQYEYSPEVELTVEMAESYRLSSTYPNPFDHQASFTLAVQESQHVSIELFNQLGQRVQQLHDGPLTPHEEHQFAISADPLANGVYFLRIRGENFSDTQQAVVLK